MYFDLSDNRFFLCFILFVFRFVLEIIIFECSWFITVFIGILFCFFNFANHE